MTQQSAWKNRRLEFNGRRATGITANLAERRLMDRARLAADVQAFVASGGSIVGLPHRTAERREYVGWDGRLL